MVSQVSKSRPGAPGIGTASSGQRPNGLDKCTAPAASPALWRREWISPCRMDALQPFRSGLLGRRFLGPQRAEMEFDCRAFPLPCANVIIITSQCRRGAGIQKMMLRSIESAIVMGTVRTDLFRHGHCCCLAAVNCGDRSFVSLN